MRGFDISTLPDSVQKKYGIGKHATGKNHAHSTIKKKREFPESKLQQSIIAWARAAQSTMPGLELLHHVPNGGHRNAIEAKLLKAEGVLAGIPDLCLPVPRGTSHGIYIELKAGKGKLSKHQEKICIALVKNDYYVITCRTAEDAIMAITDYLKQ